MQQQRKKKYIYKKTDYVRCWNGHKHNLRLTRTTID